MPGEPWQIRDGSLCKGELVLGDGTEEQANREIVDFGINYYRMAFYMNADPTLDLLDPGKRDQGRFILVTETLPEKGETEEKIGNSLPAQTVRDLLTPDPDDGYMILYREEKIDGEECRCFYTVILNEERNAVIGIARTSVLKNTITNLVKEYSHLSDIVMILTILVVFAVVYLITYRTASAFARMVNYLEKICRGEMPEEPLYLGKSKRMQSLAEKVNQLAAGKTDAAPKDKEV